MSIKLMEAFDQYGTGAASLTNMAALGSFINTQTTVAGPTYCGVPSWGPAYTGPYCLVSKSDLKANKAYAARYLVQGNAAINFVSFRYAYDTTPVNNNTTTIIDFRDNSNTVMAYMSVATDGSIQVRNSSGTVLGSSAAGTLTAQTFHFIELKWDSNTTTLTVRVDDSTGAGTAAITLTNAAISAGLLYIGLIPCVDTNSGDSGLFQYQYIDDLIIRDSNGTTSNSWMGYYRVAYVPASTIFSTFNWSATPATSSASVIVGKTVPDDTSYMSTALSSNNTLSAQLNGIPGSVTNIAAIQTVCRIWKTDVGSVDYSITYRGNFTNGSSTTGNIVANSTASIQPSIFSIDPDRSDIITPTSLSLCRLEISRTV